MRIITWNVNGLKAVLNRRFGSIRSLLQYLRAGTDYTKSGRVTLTSAKMTGNSNSLSESSLAVQTSFAFKRPNFLKQTWSGLESWPSAKTGKRVHSLQVLLAPHTSALRNRFHACLQGLLLQLLPDQGRICWGCNILQNHHCTTCCC